MAKIYLKNLQNIGKILSFIEWFKKPRNMILCCRLIFGQVEMRNTFKNKEGQIY